VTCQYCQSSISVAEFFKEASSETVRNLQDKGLTDEEMLKVSRLLEGAEFFIDSGDYKKAQGNLNDVLCLAPSHLPSRFNLALCELYSGIGTSEERAMRAAKLVSNAAKDYEMIPDLLKLKETIAYNICSIGLTHCNAQETMKFINISKSLVSDYKDRDKLIMNFYEDVFLGQKKIFDAEVNLRRKGYSPNQTTLNFIIAGAAYSQNLADLGATILLHLDENKSAMHSKISPMISELRENVLLNCSNEIDKLKFGIFGVKTSKIAKDNLRN